MRNRSASPIGVVIRSKYGSPTDSRRAAQRLGDQREHGAEQHDERERGEQEVVEQERRLTRDRRVDAPGCAQRVAAPREQSDAGCGDDAEEREQPRPDVGLA